jgi:hypothetical protein
MERYYQLLFSVATISGKLKSLSIKAFFQVPNEGHKFCLIV